MRLLGLIGFFFYSGLAFATDVVGAINNMLVPMAGVTQILYGASMVLGMAFLGGAFVRFLEYRRNPVQVRLSSPIILAVLGAVLVLVPMLAKYSEGDNVLKGAFASVSQVR